MARMYSECCTVLSWLHHKISWGHTQLIVYIIALVFLSALSDPLENLVTGNRNWQSCSLMNCIKHRLLCVISGFHSGVDED
jgi:hypothetical protein